MKFIKQVLGRGGLFYEARLAPWIARKGRWLYWPIYRLCRKFGICFIVNIAGGTGHIICELDYFSRKLHAKEILAKKRYVWIRKPDVYSLTCVALYGNNFWYARCNTILYYLLLPLTMAFSEITLDCGLSRLKWQLTPDKKHFRPLFRQTYLYQIPKKEGIDAWSKYFIMRQKSASDFPLTKGRLEKERIFDRGSKLALIHIKTNIGNATALPTDPFTYLPALFLLLRENYQLVFVGRERMPKEFLDLPIFNYSESKIASFKNDIRIFNEADLAIVGGSGISLLADCYGKPYLYLNSWHLPMALFSPKAILVPTLVQRKGGEFLTFAEQMELYSSSEDKGAEVFPQENYTARNASADEISYALQELLALPSPLTPLQRQYQNLRPGTPLFYAQSRCSSYFLQKHTSLFRER